MPSRRSPAKLAERAARRGALAHVQKREILVAGREARVDQRERKAEKFNEDALALAGEAVGIVQDASVLMGHRTADRRPATSALTPTVGNSSAARHVAELSELRRLHAARRRSGSA